MAHLETFIGALVVAYLVPGPDLVLVLETASVRGRAQGLATAAGLAVARGAHVVMAAAGLAALLKTSPWVFELVRWIGVLYLVWLGIRIGRSASWSLEDSVATPGSPPRAYRSAAWRGLLTNFTNPKSLLFCSVLLPQFIDIGNGSVASQFLLLGTILVGLGVLFDLFYIAGGRALGLWMQHRPWAQRLQRGLFATLLIGFALRLAMSHPL
ncbi:MAG: lysine transporter LysE [Alcanivorax sp.]|nr:MAG: lysine transporter LysE [Alcanivorax sp.]